MRKLPALITVATVAVLALTGCSGSPSSTPTASAAAELTCTDPGTSSNAVTVAGAAGVEPTVTFTAPLTATATERTVITKGDGDAVKTGESVEAAFVVYNGTSGARIDGGGYGTDTGMTVTVSQAEKILPGILKAVACSNVGSRITVVVPPADAFGTTGNTSLNIAATDDLVFVVDIKGKVATPVADPTPPTTDATRAKGEAQTPQDGFPTVVLADDGTPTITMPATAAPTELKTEVLIKGDGAMVPDGAAVTVQYVGAIWGTGKVFDQSWGKGTGPSTFVLSKLVAGFSQGLIGQTVGSQVVIVVPPDLGYGSAGRSEAGIAGTDTIVFVVDILASS